jgi:hypothetical protein
MRATSLEDSCRGSVVGFPMSSQLKCISVAAFCTKITHSSRKVYDLIFTGDASQPLGKLGYVLRLAAQLCSRRKILGSYERELTRIDRNRSIATRMSSGIFHCVELAVASCRGDCQRFYRWDLFQPCIEQLSIFTLDSGPEDSCHCRDRFDAAALTMLIRADRSNGRKYHALRSCQPRVRAKQICFETTGFVCCDGIRIATRKRLVGLPNLGAARASDSMRSRSIRSTTSRP